MRIVLCLLFLLGVAQAQFKLSPGASWPPTGVMTPERANCIRYAEAFAVKVELMMAVTGQNFFDLLRNAQSTALIGLPSSTSWIGARNELTHTWAYGMMLEGYYSGWYSFNFQAPKDDWIDLYRGLTVVDAAQTWAIKQKGEDFNPIYRGMNGPQAFGTALLVGLGAERIVTGLPPKDRKWAGWLLVAVRVFDVIYNADHGVTLWTVRF
jgi:hypothetical protein